MALSVAKQPIRRQLKTITIQNWALGFQDLYFLNIVTCIVGTCLFRPFLKRSLGWATMHFIFKSCTNSYLQGDFLDAVV